MEMIQEEKVQDYVSSKIAKHWTIQEAKEGDVLATDNGDLCLFDGTVEEGKYPFAYCGLTRHGFEFYDRTLPFTHDYVSPATERQRDLFFQKMKEAGYKWDINKKELINMKDLSIKEKARAYDEAVKKAEEIVKYYKTHNRNDETSIEDIETIFPELNESEDERIGKGIKSILEHYKESGEVVCPYPFVSIDEALAWLEKQGEQSVEPDWCHHKVDFSGCSEEYRKAYYDGWNDCNMQYSQRKAELDDVVKYLLLIHRVNE